jgi:hypothetical protein
MNLTVPFDRMRTVTNIFIKKKTDAEIYEFRALWCRELKAICNHKIRRKTYWEWRRGLMSYLLAE